MTKYSSFALALINTFGQRPTLHTIQGRVVWDLYGGSGSLDNCLYIYIYVHRLGYWKWLELRSWVDFMIENGSPFCQGIGHHRYQHHLNISIYYMCVIRRSDHINIMYIQFNSNEYQKKTCFDIWWYWISQKLLARSLIVNAFDWVYVITLIIPISVCGMNSQNMHYLVQSQN